MSLIDCFACSVFLIICAIPFLVVYLSRDVEGYEKQ